MIQSQSHPRVENPARWAKAAERAAGENIQVRQLQGSGQWVASSGSDATVAYGLEVTGNVAHGCDCLAGLNADPVCKHRAAFYLLIGALTPPEPDPPAPIAPVVCFRCQGREVGCPICAGIGAAPLAAQASALIAEAGEAWPRTPVAPTVPAAAVAHIGQAGHIAGYDVFLAGDTLHVTHAASGRAWRHVVPNYGTALADLARQPGLRLGWVRFRDDAEALYVYDREDGHFGYALNLSDPSLSEWGYAPFGGEGVCDHCGGPLDDDAETDDALQTLCGECLETDRAASLAALHAAISEAQVQQVAERASVLAA